MNMKTAVGIAFAAVFATVVPLSAQEVKQTLTDDAADTRSFFDSTASAEA